MNILNHSKRSLLFFGILIFGLTACTEEDELLPPTQNSYIKSGELTSDEIWTEANIYTLRGKVIVPDGVKLTIEAGTIIKAEGGQGTTASALIIAQGGEIHAVGTAEKPIIFTSVADNIALGEKVGTNLDRDDNQLWGGIIILGKAPISAESGDTESAIEGIPAEEEYGHYGGNEANDNSGKMAYVSIRHCGISIGAGNEINGLTLGGVGSETEISQIEVYATLDDGIEFFGGTVNVDGFLCYYQGDDGVDIDQNYSGTLSNFGVIHGDGISTDEGIEADGPEGSTHTTGLFTLSDGYCILEGVDGSAANFKSGAQGVIEMVTFQSESPKPVNFRTKFDKNCEVKEDAYSHLISTPPTLQVIDSSLEGGLEVYDGDADSSNPTACPEVLVSANSLASSIVNASGSGANIDLGTYFYWTCAATRNQL